MGDFVFTLIVGIACLNGLVGLAVFFGGVFRVDHPVLGRTFARSGATPLPSASSAMLMADGLDVTPPSGIFALRLPPPAAVPKEARRHLTLV